MASDSGSKRELAGRTVDMLVDVAQQITTLSIGLIVVLAGFLEWRGIQSASGRWIASVVVILFGSCILMALRAQTQFSMVLTYQMNCVLLHFLSAFVM